MPHRILQRALAAGMAVFLISACALLAQDASVLAGKWNMTSETSGDPVTWTLVLKNTDGKLTASLSTEGGEVPAKAFTYKEGVLKFKAPYQGQDYDIELKASGAKLTGNWSGNGDTGETYGTKAP